ncbi:cupin domain-containing protein [Thiomicrorhabdus sp. 6S2-11]|uniref:Cupin domain-containing protein n=1 Tax=Thiomicrorhabdus marina TaxID=2818442 RepID=A0ABS3Q435_9GAMM|nr:cupin domain-containing protein [Thiomicrorhabdus marina]MBO1926858.1 cupin domain-containing protein [Thiomicrorhabdus marina]
MQIEVIQNPAEAIIEQHGCHSWPIWEKEISNFSWFYDSTEVCLILEGEVTVTPDDGKAVKIVAGDLVTFPAGMACTWDITSPIRKHYKFL